MILFPLVGPWPAVGRKPLNQLQILEANDAIRGHRRSTDLCKSLKIAPKDMPRLCASDGGSSSNAIDITMKRHPTRHVHVCSFVKGCGITISRQETIKNCQFYPILIKNHKSWWVSIHSLKRSSSWSNWLPGFPKAQDAPAVALFPSGQRQPPFMIFESFIKVRSVEKKIERQIPIIFWTLNLFKGFSRFFYRDMVPYFCPTWQQFANATATATAQAAWQQRSTQRLQVEPGREM